MQKIDFHGWLLSDAEQELHMMVGAARIGKTTDHWEIITGIGLHKEQVFKIAKQYKLEAHEQVGNSGCVIVVVE